MTIYPSFLGTCAAEAAAGRARFVLRQMQVTLAPDDPNERMSVWGSRHEISTFLAKRGDRSSRICDIFCREEPHTHSVKHAPIYKRSLSVWLEHPDTPRANGSLRANPQDGCTRSILPIHVPNVSCVYVTGLSHLLRATHSHQKGATRNWIPLKAISPSGSQFQ